MIPVFKVKRKNPVARVLLKDCNILKFCFEHTKSNQQEQTFTLQIELTSKKMNSNRTVYMHQYQLPS